MSAFSKIFLRLEIGRVHEQNFSPMSVTDFFNVFGYVRTVPDDNDSRKQLNL